MTNYPSSLDTNITLPKVIDLISPIRASDHNSLQEAIIAIQTELGILPSGTFGDVKNRLNDLDDTLANGLVASVIAVSDLDGYFIGDTVEDALAELGATFATLTASLIPIVDAGGNFTATDVEAALAELASTVSVTEIGPAEDGDYTDGLFEDFTTLTPIGTAVDRFNEVLKSLAPPPAPNLSDLGFSGTGTAGNVSFGTSNAVAGYTDVGSDNGGPALDINGTFTSTGGSSLRKGIYNATTDRTGTVADAVTADTGSPTPAYPANAFNDGYVGTLQLEVNGSVVHSIDLTTFTSGSDLNGNGSGFTSVSLPTTAFFPNGDSFEIFYNRTADWIVDAADMRNGWNFVRVIHNDSPNFTRATNYFEWVVDDVVTATSYSAESVGVPTMSGSKYISGVQYHTGGTASYDVTISNLHRNTYSSSGSAITHSGGGVVTVPSSSLGTISAESDTEIISKTATIISSGIRSLNGSITVDTTTDRTVQGDVASAGATRSGILVDNVTDNSSNTNEPLNGELFRVPSNRSLTDTTGLNSGGNDSLWDQTLSITSGGAGYNDGLLVYNGQLFYPNDASVANSGNFSTITYGPGSNPNYSAATGARTWLRYFYFGSATSNFVLNLTANATVVDAGTVSSSTDEISVEFLLPNTTQDGVGTIEFKDANIAFTSIDDIGCYASTYGSNVGDTAGADWGISFGSRSTATSGNGVIIRITAGQGWTGDIQTVQFTAA